MNFQRVGDKETLKMGPKTMTPEKFSAGTMQDVGDKVKLSTNAVPMQNATTGGGQHQNIGDSVPLSLTPHKGWASASTPMSNRAIAQSKIGGKKS